MKVTMVMVVVMVMVLTMAVVVHMTMLIMTMAVVVMIEVLVVFHVVQREIAHGDFLCSLRPNGKIYVRLMLFYGDLCFSRNHQLMLVLYFSVRTA
jgi:hypothetical protein